VFAVFVLCVTLEQAEIMSLSGVFTLFIAVGSVVIGVFVLWWAAGTAARKIFIAYQTPTEQVCSKTGAHHCIWRFDSVTCFVFCDLFSTISS
jgi:hypothetical protein